MTELHTEPAPATDLSREADEDIDVDMEGDISSDQADGYGDTSSGAKDDDEDSEDDEIIAEWPPTPQKEKAYRDDDLPPESSPLQSSPPVIRLKPTNMARSAMWNASQSTSGRRTDTVFEEPSMTPIDGDQDMDIDQPPKTVDTARLFSSAVRPETVTPGPLQEPKPSNNYLQTLSSSNFGDLVLAVDGADSDLPSEVTGAMAEQQLLRDLKESVHHVSDDVQAPATPARLPNGRSSRQNSPTSSIATRKRREAPDMSPKDIREQKVSRFNFTQESPVSQNPALEAAKARQEFLKGRKNSKQPVAPPPKVASSPSRVEQSSEDVLAEDDIEPEIDTGVEFEVEDTSLYGEFKRAYPSYTAPVKHFETMCKNLAASCRKGHVLCHPMLWDDYIARSVSDYLVYCREQLFAAEPQDPYDKYYNEQIEGSLHEKKVVTRAKLVEWFGPEALTYV